MFDLQVNGFYTDNFSCDFWQGAQDIDALNEFLYKEGINNYLATLITDSYEATVKNLSSITPSDNLAGVHIEGGLITRMGVHPEKFSQEFDLKKVQDLVKKFPKLIRLWTFCPSLDKDGSITKFLQDSGIKVSYGHSGCDYETAWNAFEKYDVSLVTHWGNAMYVCDGFKQRESTEADLNLLDEVSEDKAGIGLAAYRHPKVNLMIIAGAKENHDEHIDPKLIKKLFSKKEKQIILVSDMVHYDKKEAPEHLVGGLSSLKIHAQNALNIGIDKAAIKHATSTLPREIIPID